MTKIDSEIVDVSKTVDSMSEWERKKFVTSHRNWLGIELALSQTHY